MLETRVIPCLLLNNNGLVKTVKFKSPKYVGDPINAIKIFNNKEVDELIFLDTTATIENNKPNFKLIADLASECFMPFAYGGGIRDLNDIRKIISLGVEKVIINSYAFENPFFIKEASTIFGSQSIIISIDVKKTMFGKYEMLTHGGTKSTKCDPVEFAQYMEEMGAGELFLNSIDRDGTMKGYDVNLIKKISESVNLPIIACGGAGKIGDFANAVVKGHASAVAAGSFFVFYGKYQAVLINYPSRHEMTELFKI